MLPTLGYLITLHNLHVREKLHQVEGAWEILSQKAQSDAQASINQEKSQSLRPKSSEKYGVSIKVQGQAPNAPRRNNMAPFTQQVEDKISRSQEPIETISPSLSKKSG